MQSYDIIITPDAEIDLNEIKDYIAYELFSPDTALTYTNEIKALITKLEYLAPSIAPVPDEPFHSMGIRKIIANKFFVYFWINENANTVFILNVIYQRRDQLKALTHLNKSEKQ